MVSKTKIEKVISEEDYWTCRKCKISTLTEDRMCPCPRDSCEAVLSGTVTTVAKIKLNS